MVGRANKRHYSSAFELRPKPIIDKSTMTSTANTRSVLRGPLLPFLFAFALTLLAGGQARAVPALALDMAVKGLTTAEPPHMVGDVLILSYRGDSATRFVAARFEHEAYQVLHTYNRNPNGVFVLDYEVPEGVLNIRYRIVVDGLWMEDPTESETDTDQFGTVLSVFALAQEPFRPIVNPKQQPDGSLTFTFRGTPGKRVSLIGDFNNWDPFMDYLTETAPGVFSITLRVAPGPHWYCYFTEGRRVLDRYNVETGSDPDGTKTSYFSSSS